MLWATSALSLLGCSSGSRISRGECIQIQSFRSSSRASSFLVHYLWASPFVLEAAKAVLTVLFVQSNPLHSSCCKEYRLRFPLTDCEPRLRAVPASSMFTVSSFSVLKSRHHGSLTYFPVSELHVWSLSESKSVASVHIMTRGSDFVSTSKEIRKILHKFGIHSS